MIGMYGSSPKVKCRDACKVHSSWIAELQILSRDIDFAEIVCRFRSERASRDRYRFRRDRVSISPGDRLEFVEDQLRFEKSSSRWSL